MNKFEILTKKPKKYIDAIKIAQEKADEFLPKLLKAVKIVI